MAEKLDKSAFPVGHGAGDFECFGPPATRDGQFQGVNIVDMGCFTQDGKDSNKYYHAAVVKSRRDSAYYAYFEWGRTGATSPQFQFVKCSSLAEAQSEFAKQCHEKNDKRGQWVDKPPLGRILQAKPGKDCYLVRAMATRVTGLPDAKTIKLNEGAKVAAKVAETQGKKSPPKKAVDQHTTNLLRDLGQATIAYTRTSMADASLPTQNAIEEARQILQVALQRVAAVGDDVTDQVADRELIELTTLMYGRIPKKKPLGAAANTWILSGTNILGWQADLDAFESALYAHDDADVAVEDPYNGMNIHMEWIDPVSELGKFLHGWWPNATRNVHGNLSGKLQIVNAWQVVQHDQTIPFRQALEGVRVEKVTEKCLHQPGDGGFPSRIDLDGMDAAYRAANVNLLVHGSRSINIPGILRERLKLPHQLIGVAINGALYGPGVYMADDVKKSAQYTSLTGGIYSSGTGGVKGRHAFMFVADVIIGNPHVANAMHGYTRPPNGCHSVFGKGGYSAQLRNNEWVVYNTAQHQMRYLIEFKEGTAASRRKW